MFQTLLRYLHQDINYIIENYKNNKKDNITKSYK